MITAHTTPIGSRFCATGFRHNPAKATAAILLPTLAIYAPIAHFGSDVAWVAFLGAGAYFLRLLALVARSPRRRRWALGLAAAALAVEATILMVLGDNDLGLQAAVFFVLPTAYIAAWGIARRRNTLWWTRGLPLAALTAVLPIRIAASEVVSAGSPSFLTFWILGPGVVVVGSLICWAFDLGEGRADNRGNRAV